MARYNQRLQKTIQKAYSRMPSILLEVTAVFVTKCSKRKKKKKGSFVFEPHKALLVKRRKKITWEIIPWAEQVKNSVIMMNWRSKWEFTTSRCNCNNFALKMPDSKIRIIIEKLLWLRNYNPENIQPSFPKHRYLKRKSFQTNLQSKEQKTNCTS